MESADVRIGEGRAWVVVDGLVDNDRAVAVRRVVDDLSHHESIRRVSVDLTCAITVDPAAAASLDLVRLGAEPWVDVAGPGVVGRLLRRTRSAGRQERRQPHSPMGSRGTVTMGDATTSLAPRLTPTQVRPASGAPLHPDDRIPLVMQTRP